MSKHQNQMTLLSNDHDQLMLMYNTYRTSTSSANDYKHSTKRPMRNESNNKNNLSNNGNNPCKNLFLLSHSFIRLKTKKYKMFSFVLDAIIKMKHAQFNQLPAFTIHSIVDIEARMEPKCLIKLHAYFEINNPLLIKLGCHGKKFSVLKVKISPKSYCM